MTASRDPSQAPALSLSLSPDTSSQNHAPAVKKLGLEGASQDSPQPQRPVEKHQYSLLQAGARTCSGKAHAEEPWEG